MGVEKKVISAKEILIDSEKVIIYPHFDEDHFSKWFYTLKKIRKNGGFQSDLKEEVQNALDNYGEFFNIKNYFLDKYGVWDSS